MGGRNPAGPFQYLSLPLEVARTLDNDLLRLVGFNRSSMGMGSWGGRQDPLASVKPGERSAGVMPDARAEVDRTDDPDAVLGRLPRESSADHLSGRRRGAERAAWTPGRPRRS